MRKRSRKIKNDLVALESKEKKVGIWGIFALILIVFGFIIAPLLPGIFDNAHSSGLKFGSYKGQPIYYKKIVSLPSMLIIIQIFILDYKEMLKILI